MATICDELNVDTELRCVLPAGHTGAHVSKTQHGGILPFYTQSDEKQELVSALASAETSALDLARHLRRASLAVSRLFP
jgi:hypothetical protein